MPLKSYGVFKGRAIDRRLGTGGSPHYQVHMVDQSSDYRIAVNVASQLQPSELEYLIDSEFRHPIVEQLHELAPGWKPLPPKPGGISLDFIRGNLFDPRRMRKLGFNVPGPDNDLNEKIDHYIQRAMADEDAQLYAFGERWGPESIKDKIFGFLPGNGVHDIHMNQANVGKLRQGRWRLSGRRTAHRVPQTESVGRCVSQVSISDLAQRRSHRPPDRDAHERSALRRRRRFLPRSSQADSRPRPCPTARYGSSRRSSTRSSPRKWST